MIISVKQLGGWSLLTAKLRGVWESVMAYSTSYTQTIMFTTPNHGSKK